MMVFLFFILPLLTHMSNMKGKIFYNNTLMQTIEIQDMEHRILEAAKQVFVRRNEDGRHCGGSRNQSHGAALLFPDERITF